MGNTRFKALEIAGKRDASPVFLPSYTKISTIFGEMTFNNESMQQFLSDATYKRVLATIERNEKIDRKTADEIALAMKIWAISKGATHYTHWFQPLTGSSAEKHDSFFTVDDTGKAVEFFDGSSLIQQEPDASSFPNGGIRNTFEARGYTAWDPSSPAFIIDKTLCIPTIFVSYTSEALDYKAPLLKALHFLDTAATEVAQLFDTNIKRVKATLGIEQEYFLVDETLYNARPDLALSGRTLFGHASAKDQQLEDNYFGSIPERVVNFMKDIEYQAYLLGIPIRTRHNEVAPNQFECAPLHEEINIAIDHNVLLMDIMSKTARRHHFRVLMHEKPYAGINGSGKHNNFSLMTDQGDNLLSPGKTPASNLKFLTFFLAIIEAVNVKNDLLRASIASASNDMRLGGNEAPPAIMSVFIGEQLTAILNAIEKSKFPILGSSNEKNKKHPSLAISHIPEILLDNTDRNRTSPFAFTGNKFEFRAVGSSTNSAAPMIALLTMVGSQLTAFKAEVDKLTARKMIKEEAIVKVLKKYIINTKRVRFDGNNYSQEWLDEAKERGLLNTTSTPEALKIFVDSEVVKMYEDAKVLSHRELEARMDIQLENYTKKIQIESRTIGDIAINHILPVAIRYQNILIENVKGLQYILPEEPLGNIAGIQLQNIKDISFHITQIHLLVNEMVETRKNVNRKDDNYLKAKSYRERVLPFFDQIRAHADSLELMVDDELWPLPKYRELLFIN
ncbi:MAG: glutamine synthetase III [Bacteroidetes bacterium]|nr:glutamine synthetase III [Bacteroidota bacterium]